MGDLPVMSGQTFVRVTSVLGIFDQQTVVLGYLETTHSAHQFSAAKYMTGTLTVYKYRGQRGRAKSLPPTIWPA